MNQSDIAGYLLQEEKRLSPFATKSSESLGRKFPIDPDPFRLEFARDNTRILHCRPFRRLKHKTQVFLSPDNDHICTRMEHVLHVSSIATVIGRCLRLNTDLIHAIAIGHDLGHAPFGHVGERKLNNLLVGKGVKDGFQHELHGLRVVDKLTHFGKGLNLTYEVRDGIMSHCGEKFEQKIKPDRTKDLHTLEKVKDRTSYPATLEGCLVRMVDRIAFLGRDLEDGIKAGLVKKKDIPKKIAKELGIENGKIIGSLVNDTITCSIDRDSIELSNEMFELMTLLRDFNYASIYLHPEVERKAHKAEMILEHLFFGILKILKETDYGKDTATVNQLTKDAPTIATLFNFIRNSNYTENTLDTRMVTDYIAGMTDAFAQRSYLQLFLPSPVI